MNPKTPFLYHGPTARDKALQTVTQAGGRLVTEPIGDTGLKVEDARNIVEFTMNPGIGDKPPYLIVGPLCQGTPEALDALLKTLEEIQSSPVRIVLWCDYLKEVIPTIKSRAIVVWCPPGNNYVPLHDYKSEEAKSLLKAYNAQDWYTVISLVEASSKDWIDLMRAFVDILEDTELWERVRGTLDGKGGYLTALDALLPKELT